MAKRLRVVKKDIYISKKEFISSESTMFFIGNYNIITYMYFVNPYAFSPV